MKHSLATSSITLKDGPLPSLDAVISSNANSSTSFSLKILIAFIGSPTYLGSWNFTVLTRPWPLRRRHGIARARNISSDSREITQQSHAEAVTFLGMKLYSHNVFTIESRVEESGKIGR